MKNYKLDVVRYNNEDVIATSGSTSSYGAGDCLAYVVRKQDSSVYGCQYPYMNGAFVDGGTGTDNSLPIPYDEAIVNNFYHFNRITGEYGLCTHEGHHGITAPDPD